LLFIDAVILPDLHRLATAGTCITLASDDDVLPSPPLSSQCAPAADASRHESVRHTTNMKMGIKTQAARSHRPADSR
jgi:hypothetical protein